MRGREGQSPEYLARLLLVALTMFFGCGLSERRRRGHSNLQNQQSSRRCGP